MVSEPFAVSTIICPNLDKHEILKISVHIHPIESCLSLVANLFKDYICIKYVPSQSYGAEQAFPAISPLGSHRPLLYRAQELRKRRLSLLDLQYSLCWYSSKEEETEKITSLECQGLGARPRQGIQEGRQGYCLELSQGQAGEAGAEKIRTGGKESGV